MHYDIILLLVIGFLDGVRVPTPSMVEFRLIHILTISYCINCHIAWRNVVPDLMHYENFDCSLRAFTHSHPRAPLFPSYHHHPPRSPLLSSSPLPHPSSSSPPHTHARTRTRRARLFPRRFRPPSLGALDFLRRARSRSLSRIFLPS